MAGCLVLWNTSCDLRAGKPEGKNINIMAHGKTELMGSSKKKKKNRNVGCEIEELQPIESLPMEPQYALRLRVMKFFWFGGFLHLFLFGQEDRNKH